jgi:hypothetical protein
VEQQTSNDFFHNSKLKNVGGCFRRLRFRFALALPDLLGSPFPEHIQELLGVTKILCPDPQVYSQNVFHSPSALYG